MKNNELIDDIRSITEAIDPKVLAKDMAYDDQLKLSRWLKRSAKVKESVYFDDADLVYGDKTVVDNAIGPDSTHTVADLLKALIAFSKNSEKQSKAMTLSKTEEKIVIGIVQDAIEEFVFDDKVDWQTPLLAELSDIIAYRASRVSQLKFR